MLHDRSFEDDPMRIVRGIRLEVRLGFSFEPNTQQLLQSAISAGVVGRVRPQRRFEELRKALMEPQWQSVMARLDECGCLNAMFSGLRLSAQPIKTEDWVARFVSLCPDRILLDKILWQAGVAHVGKFHEAYERHLALGD